MISDIEEKMKNKTQMKKKEREKRVRMKNYLNYLVNDGR